MYLIYKMCSTLYSTLYNTLYVLKLNNNKYYVGVTNNFERRYKEHKSGNGANWTKLHEVKEIMLTIDISSKNAIDMENSITYKMMLEYGINNVRGGRWCSCDDYNLFELCNLISSKSNKIENLLNNENSHDEISCEKSEDNSQNKILLNNHGKKWTDKLDEELKEMFVGTVNENLENKINELSIHFQRTPGSITARLMYLKLLKYCVNDNSINPNENQLAKYFENKYKNDIKNYIDKYIVEYISSHNEYFIDYETDKYLTQYINNMKKSISEFEKNITKLLLNYECNTVNETVETALNEIKENILGTNLISNNKIENNFKIKKSKVYFSREIYMSKLSYVNEGDGNLKLIYDGISALTLQSPRIKVTKLENSSNKVSFKLLLDTSSSKIIEFKKILEKIDEYNLKYMSEHSMELFGTEISMCEIKKFKFYTSMFNSSIDKDNKCLETLEIKLQVFENGPIFTVFKNKGKELILYNSNTKEIDWSWFEDGMEIIPLIQSGGILIKNGTAFFEWILCSAMLP